MKARVRAEPDKYVLLFQDEASFYRQPSQAHLWARSGRIQPKMRYASRANTCMRVLAYLNGQTGAVHAEDYKSVTAQRLAASLSKLPSVYPGAKRIYVVWDNWPVHEHPKVKRALDRHPRLEVVPLPTYAPWLNPVEKTWRWTRQRVSHAHPWCDDFRQFRAQVIDELQRHAGGSQEMLRYAGLST